MTSTAQVAPRRFGPPHGLETYAFGNLVATVGSGITLTASVFYFVRVASVSPSTVAFAMTTGAIAGLAGMPVVGRMAGAWGAKPVYLSLLAVQTIALLSWQFADAAGPAFLCLALTLVAERGINAVVGGFIAELDMPVSARATGRAYLRSLTNVGLAMGGGLASVALWQGSEPALRTLIGVAATMPAVAAVFVAKARTTRSVPPTEESGRVRARPFRDRRFVALAVTNGVMAVHLDVLAVGLPLVLTTSDGLPDWIGGVAIATNAILVVILQVPTTGRIQIMGARSGALIAGATLSISIVLLGAAAETAAFAGVVLIGLWIVFDTCAELTQSAVEFVVSYDAAPSWAHSEYQAAYAFGRGAVRALAPVTLALVVSQGLPAWVLLAIVCGGAGLLHSHIARGVTAHG